jgi:hypothetical protein
LASIDEAACEKALSMLETSAAITEALTIKIEALEGGIVAENRRTSEIEAELEAVKSLLIARDEDFHPDGEAWSRTARRMSGLASVVQVVERILNERDDAERERDESRGAIPDETSGAVAASFSREREASHERDRANARIKTLEGCLASERELTAKSNRALDAADERASTATDILCGALGKDHGRGGLVEHCQKAADKIARLKTRDSNLGAAQAGAASPAARLSCVRCGGKGKVQQIVSYGEGEMQGGYMNEHPCPACAARVFPLAADEVADLRQGAKAAMGQLIMRSDLVAACKRAGLTGLVAELEREP